MARSNNFDALRLIAALAVLCSHMAAIGGELEWRPIHRITPGLFAVMVFFAISGYLVMASWRRDPNIGRFLERRFLRLGPALLISMPATFLLVKALGLYGFPDNPLQVINGSLWTIEYEIVCYFVLVALAVVSKSPALIAGLIVAVAINMGLGGYFAAFAAHFALGMMLFEYPKYKRWSLLLVPLGLALLQYHYIATALIIVPLAVFIGERSWPVLRSAGRYGDVSYGVYIYAFPIQQIVVAYMGADTPYFTLLSVCLPLVLIAAWLSWHFVEKPALARKPEKPANMIDQQPAAAAYAVNLAADNS